VETQEEIQKDSRSRTVMDGRDMSRACVKDGEIGDGGTVLPLVCQGMWRSNSRIQGSHLCSSAETGN
jgi:hypothetical protein